MAPPGRESRPADNGPAQEISPTPIDQDPTRVAEVWPLSVSVSRGVRTVAIACPHCGSKHVHGWPDAATEPGHRVAHCGAENGYLIHAPKRRLPQVAIRAVVIDLAGRLSVVVLCAFCEGLHTHKAAGRLDKVRATCGGGHYAVTAGVPDGPTVEVVACRHVPGELCISCGPDRDQLLPMRILTSAEVVA